MRASPPCSRISRPTRQRHAPHPTAPYSTRTRKPSVSNLSPTSFPQSFSSTTTVTPSPSPAAAQESLLAYVEQMRLQQAISTIVAADDVSRVKPDPEMALKALAQIGGESQDTIVVGDMIFDIQMGKSAHMKTCAVTYGNGTSDQFASADYVIDDFKLLLPIVG